MEAAGVFASYKQPVFASFKGGEHCFFEENFHDALVSALH